jgi:DNA polymerase-3 subunit beta
MRIGKETINRALSLAKGVMPSKASNPLLTYLWLEGREGDLVLQASSGETDLEVRLPVEDGVEFAPILVPGLPFTLTVGNAPGDTVEFTLEPGSVTVAAGKWRASLATASPEGFPEWPEMGPDRLNSHIAAKDLAKALSSVRYAVGKEDYRAIFRGVQLEFYERGFRAVASDGYRIAIQDLLTPEGEPARKVVLTSWGVDDLLHFLREAEEGGEVRITQARGLMEVAFAAPWGEVRASLRLMEGEFPNYWRVIPTEFPLKVVLDVGPFREALKRVSVLADKQNHRVDLLLEEGRAVLSAKGDYGEGQEELPVVLEGPPMSLAYSARYLLEALQWASGKVTLYISGQVTPTLIEPAEGGYRAVVVPLRV